MVVAGGYQSGACQGDHPGIGWIQQFEAIHIQTVIGPFERFAQLADLSGANAAIFVKTPDHFDGQWPGANRVNRALRAMRAGHWQMRWDAHRWQC